MAGTRTSGSVDGTPQRKDVSFTMVDESGDVRTVSFQVPASATNEQIEAVATALQAASNASLFRVGVEFVYEGAMDTDNASDAVHPSVFDNVSIGYRDVTTGNSKTAYIVAPIDAITLEGDAVDTEQAQYVAYRDAVDTLLDGNYAPRFARFTERREINRRSPA